jgi:hypothetical protein
MADLELKEGVKNPAPESGQVKSEKRTDKRELKEEELSEREKQIIKERKENAGRITVNHGNVEELKLIVLQQIRDDQKRILAQLIEMNYYMSKQVPGEGKEKPEFMKIAKTDGEKKSG